MRNMEAEEKAERARTILSSKFFEDSMAPVARSIY